MSLKSCPLYKSADESSLSFTDIAYTLFDQVINNAVSKDFERVSGDSKNRKTFEDSLEDDFTGKA
jgi:hypothetical protein